ncbi:rCG44390 [Rattus norvegicus]|uniref:RCG44390 n=1 Tax=Rattus norvegicus TaxID=10116 RepID=A6I5S3_RAT|nr:rCG44390 [Rattus norvegicus]
MSLSVWAAQSLSEAGRCQEWGLVFSYLFSPKREYPIPGNCPQDLAETLQQGTPAQHTST